MRHKAQLAHDVQDAAPVQLESLGYRLRWQPFPVKSRDAQAHESPLLFTALSVDALLFLQKVTAGNHDALPIGGLLARSAARVRLSRKAR
jgi:hypothetical protein